MLKNISIIVIGTLLFVGCGSSTSTKENKLVTHDFFEETSSNLFVIQNLKALSSANKLDHVIPQVAPEHLCEHIGAGLEGQGLHFHFNRQNISGGYLVEVFAPVDGKVDLIGSCTDTCNKDGCTGNTQYSVILEIAKHLETKEPIFLQFSFEPMILNKSCSLPKNLNGVESNSTYADLIYVQKNDFVKKGTLIANFWVPEDEQYRLDNPNNWKNATHIHMNLKMKDVSICPNIFNDNISSEFSNFYNNANRVPFREECASINNYSGICAQDDAVSITNFYSHD